MSNKAILDLFRLDADFAPFDDRSFWDAVNEAAGERVQEHPGGPNHDQKSHGRGGALTGDAAKVRRESARLTRRMMTEGGFTYEPKSGTPVKSGWVVNPSKASEKRFGVDDLTDEKVAGYIARHLDYLKANPRAALGGWYDKDGTGDMFLDISEVYPTGEAGRKSAIKTAVQASQYGILHLDGQDYYELTEADYRENGGPDWEAKYKGR